MNRINDIGHYFLLFEVISFLCLIFYDSNLKGLFKRFSVKKVPWNFLKNNYEPWKMSMKELISLRSLILPRKNSFTGILEGLCLLICDTIFFFLTTDTLKIDGTEESLHSTDESEEEENDTSISNL